MTLWCPWIQDMVPQDPQKWKENNIYNFHTFKSPYQITILYMLLRG